MINSPRRIRVLDPDDLPVGFALPPSLHCRAPRLSARFPVLYRLAVFYHQQRRFRQWRDGSQNWANEYSRELLPARVLRHKSLLLRQLGNSEMWLQHNKVHNLKLASPHFHRLVIAPGETFSFCRAMGDASARRGYKIGLRLHDGQAQAGVGGGLCQIANLLHWMVLHTPLTVTQRSDHSFDAFPDNGRVLPWGVGCSIAFNYVDLQFRNDTPRIFQLLVEVGEKYLEGEIRADARAEFSYSVFAREEEFWKLGEEYFRRNEIWRSVYERASGVHRYDEKIKSNFALVRYAVE